MSRKDPEYKKRFQEKLKDLPSVTKKSPPSNGNLIRTVSKSCDNHINDHLGDGDTSNGILSNSLNTLLNGGNCEEDEMASRSIEYVNGDSINGNGIHIYDNNGILPSTDENGTN